MTIFGSTGAEDASTAATDSGRPAGPQSRQQEQRGATLLEEARSLVPDAVGLRRSLHAWPEVGLHLPRTQQRLLSALDGLGLDVRTGQRLSSVTATLDGAKEGPTLLLRADMDALPVREATGLDFASRVPDAMHACGHDAHTAMLAGAAQLLSRHREELAGRIIFMFQPGEEGRHGARHMIEEGVLTAGGRAADAAFALHLMPGLPSGTVRLRPGPQMAASDKLRIVVRGRGGHASAPHTAADPIPVACEIVLALHTAVTRRIAADDPAVLTVSTLSAGSLPGIIPETVDITGTIRTVSQAARERLHGAVAQVAEGVAAAHGTAAEVTVEPGYPVTVNDSVFAGFVLRVAADVLGADRVEAMPAPAMTAEDFSYVLAAVPGALAFLGACPPGLTPDQAPELHSSRLVIDEDALASGIACHAAVALRYLSASGQDTAS
ncbi:M20 metallopeptidase family protein [Streptomyces niger]|uniref:M20 metallopeptidase family protein n=1 Tax=Streptomyces niger TaxID=66373 RepID=UPI000AA586A6|nr:M20 family metallopeptidase [Streptomyces niger]